MEPAVWEEKTANYLMNGIWRKCRSNHVPLTSFDKHREVVHLVMAADTITNCNVSERHVDDVLTVANVVSHSCSTPDTQDSG